MLPRRLNLIGYVRSGQSLVNSNEQLKALENYCRDHSYHMTAVFSDAERAAFGLSQALQAIKKADGLIVYDCARLVDNPADTFRELRPLIENQFMHAHKKFISISEGFENVTTSGQANLMEVLNQWARNEETPRATYDPANHVRAFD